MRILSVLITLLAIPVTAFCQETISSDTSFDTKTVNTNINRQTTSKEKSNTWLSVVNVNDGDSLSLRQQPMSKSTLVYRIPHDAKNLIKFAEQENWFKVQYRGYLGWVYSKYVKETKHMSFANEFGGELFCLGTEPHWNLKTEGESGYFNFLGDKLALLQNDSVRESLNQNTLWMMSFSHLQEPQQHFDVTIEKSSCDDGMSDKAYNYKVHVVDTLSTQLLSGCCQLR